MNKKRHPVNALTAKGIGKLDKAGRYADGNGLYLVVDPTCAKRWVLRTVIRNRRRDMGLGSFKNISLAEARIEAQKYRAMARGGQDPIELRRREKAIIPNFEEAAIIVHEGLLPTWKNSKHANQWISTIHHYACPTIGRRPIDQVTSADILRILSPIWTTKPETAKRLAQRLSTVIRWARANGTFSGDDPVEMARTGLPRPSTLVKHHVSLEFNRLPDLIKSLHKSKADKVTKLAFEFLVLTASRTKEVCEATWDEIDLEQNIWTLAAERTKTGLIHRVPLTDRMIEILATAKQLPRPSVFIFPNQRRGVPLSYNTLLFLLQKRLKISATVHGLRSSFKDWASETTNFSNELSEMALSHKIPNKVEAAYRRGDLLEKRRLLMQTWSDYVLGIENTVIPFNLKLYTQGV